jgi:hypothetical protein
MSEVVSIHSARSASTATTGKAAAPTSGSGKSFSAALDEARKPPKGEKSEKVRGHHYDRIVAGPDKGQYLNRTGNARDGEAFRIVQRGGRTFHVYGTGHDHEVFQLPHDTKSVTVPVPTTGGTPAA